MRNENLGGFYSLEDAGFPVEHIIKEVARYVIALKNITQTEEVEQTILDAEDYIKQLSAKSEEI